MSYISSAIQEGVYFGFAASEGRKEGSKQQVQPLVSSVQSSVEGNKSCATSQKLKCELVQASASGELEKGSW